MPRQIKIRVVGDIFNCEIMSQEPVHQHTKGDRKSEPLQQRQWLSRRKKALLPRKVPIQWEGGQTNRDRECQNEREVTYFRIIYSLLPSSDRAA